MNRVSHPIQGLLAALALSLVAIPVSAQNRPADDDPTVQAPTLGSRPGVLRRQPDAEDPAEDATETDTAAPAQAEDAQGPTPSQRPDPDPRPATGDDGPTEPAEPADRADEVEARGPRVVSPEDLGISPDEFDSNFPEDPFDPFDPPSSTRVQIDFNEADLADVVMWISALTGRNFIIADTISSQKKITIISPQPVTINEAYRAFIAALNMNGLTVVPFGRFLKIVESGDAVRNAIEPTTREGQIPNDDRMVTHIHRLQHVSISNVQSILDAMTTSSASIVPYEATNTLIITETGTNLHRLLSILDELDVPSGQERIFMYQVQYASAEELRSVLLEIFQQDDSNTSSSSSRSTSNSRRRRSRDNDDSSSSTQSSGGGESPASVSVSQIIADPRTNQLIIIANERSYTRIVDIAQQLDVPIPGEGQVHVMFLENADATELASTLQSLTQSIEQQRNDSGNTSSTRRRSSDDSGGDNGGDGAVSASLSGDVSITADEATNSLIVVADLRDFVALRDVIDQLDRPRQQVYVEAVIMEATINRTTQFGVALNSGALPSVGGEEVPVFGATTLGGLSSVFLDPTSLMGLAVGLRGPEIDGTSDLFGINLPSFGAVLQAMQTNNDVNVLSTPHILTMDNEEAEIVVGENIPFISGISGGSSLGSLASLGGLTGDDNSDTSSLLGSLGGLGGFGGFGGVQVQRQDVALTLRITPHINESNFVRLEIEEEVEDVQSIDPVLGPRTTTRRATTTVVVEDQQTVVIGGLMRDSEIEDVSKVPFLGDIPVLGHLFRNTTMRTVKTNLLLLLTPYIIRDPADFQEIFRRKMEEREEFIAYFGHRDQEYVADIDYGRKDGPLQTMFESIQDAIDRDTERRRAFSTDTEETTIDAPTEGPIRIEVAPDAGTELELNDAPADTDVSMVE